MSQNVMVIGSADAPYHPLENARALEDIISDYRLTFTDNHDYFLRLSDFCLCICYMDSWDKPLNGEQATALREYLFNGGRMLNIHNGISLQATPEMSEALGARFTHHPPGCRMRIKPDAGHPVSEGVQDFYIEDEPYHFEIYGKLNIFASYDFDGTAMPAAWESKYGAGSLIYLMPGHAASSFECGGFRRLIKNSADYLRDKP